MKNLTLLNDNTNIKLNDTGTVIQFKASNEGQPVGLSNGQSATFRVKNEFGFLKSVQASTTYGGYVFELDTEDLKGLVPDTYQVELLIQVDSDNALIFPDKGFVQFSINANALNITGEQLPLMSLEDFKDELKTYVTNQTTAATTNIKNDFDTYVDNLTDSTITTATKASQDAQTAINTANTAKNTADTAKSTADTAKSTADSATTKANNAQSTADTANNKATANASLITSLNSVMSFWTNAKSINDLYVAGTLDDFNKLDAGIYKVNGWFGETQITNYPSYAIYQGAVLIVLYGPYYSHQILLTEDGNIYHKIIKLGTFEIKMEWKKIAYQS